jgi:hypothetical protein
MCKEFSPKQSHWSHIKAYTPKGQNKQKKKKKKKKGLITRKQEK